MDFHDPFGLLAFTQTRFPFRDTVAEIASLASLEQSTRRPRKILRFALGVISDDTRNAYGFLQSLNSDLNWRVNDATDTLQRLASHARGIVENDSGPTSSLLSMVEHLESVHVQAEAAYEECRRESAKYLKPFDKAVLDLYGDNQDLRGRAAKAIVPLQQQQARWTVKFANLRRYLERTAEIARRGRRIHQLVGGG